MKANELTGRALDWAVAKCIGHRVAESYGTYIRIHLPEPKQSGYTMAFCPSTDWALGGALIERERISVGTEQNEWSADITAGPTGFVRGFGATPLIAAMRCYVASKLGDTVDIPEELK